MTTKAEILKSIRAKCLDCSGYSVKEVDGCLLVACALHPFRFGRDPSPSRARGIAAQTAPSRGRVFDGAGSFTGKGRAGRTLDRALAEAAIADGRVVKVRAGAGR